MEGSACRGVLSFDATYATFEVDEGIKARGEVSGFQIHQFSVKNPIHHAWLKTRNQGTKNNVKKLLSCEIFRNQSRKTNFK